MKIGKKITGGRYKKTYKKKLYEKIGAPKQVVLGTEKKKTIRTRGGHYKTFLLSTDKMNLFLKKEKKSQVVKIKNVLEVPSNPFLARKNVLVKNAVVETDAGKARITNRPGQEACVQGVLV
jgi:small subunit ribosomal protein S8e